MHHVGNKSPSYMSRSSPFSMDPPPQNGEPHNEWSFLSWYPKGDATITYPNDDGGSAVIPGLHRSIIEERSELIAQAFESFREGHQLHLDCLDSATALPLVRYLYTGSYAPAGNHYEDVPTSLLLHCKMYRLGDLFDLADLKQQAQVNVIRQCEFGCSSPSIPIDLCEAVAYIYRVLPEHTGLLENIICYCVTCFLRHRLAQDQEFQSLAYKLRPFHQDLCKESMKREADEDDTAAAIIQMPFEPYVPQTYASREGVSHDRLEDVVYHFHGTEDEGEFKRRKTEENGRPNTTTLPMRMKQGVKQEDAAEDTCITAFMPAQRDNRSRSSPVKADSSSGNVTPEQIKVFQKEHPMLAKVRRFVEERNGRSHDHFAPASNELPRLGRPGLPLLTKPIVGESRRNASHALADYQTQLMLLEQQNKQRLLKAKEEQQVDMLEQQRAAERNAEPQLESTASKLAAPTTASSDIVVIKTEAETPAQIEDLFLDSFESDSEYEVVARPASVEALSSSDSEPDADAVLVDTPFADFVPGSRIPDFTGPVMRACGKQSRDADSNSDSDSDWDMI
ncbi:hypothetical protein CLAFUW4_11700 [Fulvia fulva]|uniref:BTB domain-containing protein n=1 Tax=Passalora fulva TaxID=5499 RepID=A0A9Q8URY2_PASFU|nr:uncharacterized protein CLAFUR5_10745 [Fulvia fulva]KAK4619679.1 hypothetical protein CLAFUR4_11705 [Fulvia fulva]KAK4620721.1 hypothetical protein CLAFUR0_11718 [Fulvia fulva]UJO20215.1 hypothetical protein CLAFUR5_10745 [Fulvia fulva]WPV17499.1 hypothetical protein CLAFUW4_11700 [Fulvia fulva]WPV32409.1 hypothetical protein CLAFUW7_11708 [Fulvia fulva]